MKRSASPGCVSTQTLSQNPSAMNSQDLDMSDTAAMEALGSHSRELIQAIQALEALQIDATLPSLPKFVVVGDQSAGKSSIIEAICDISVPRSEGTCTKCPFHITTTAAKEGESWSCEITLVRKFQYKSTARAGKGASNYDYWEQKDVADEQPFKLVSKKEELGAYLSHAQLAILDHNRDSSEYLNGTPAASMKGSPVGFSPNTVKLRIVGPNLPELSFFDLPGAINVHHDESQQHLVKFIERLIKNYLRDENALILLAVSCDQDTENSTAFRYLKECKGAANRCMGVLTKPDLSVHSGQHIHSILNHERFELGGGWFVTKSLSQKELSDGGISHAEARKREKRFFAEVEPWSSMVAFASQLGIPNLRSTISRELTVHIKKALPEISSRIENRQAMVQHELGLLPEPAEAPAFTVIHEVDRVCALISDLLNDYGLNKTFRDEYRELFLKLQEALKRGRPKLKLDTPAHQAPIDISSEEDDELVRTPSKVRKGPNGQRVSATSTPRAATPRATLSNKMEDVKMASLDLGKVVFTLDEVRRLHEQGSGSGLPDSTNPVVTDRIVLDSLTGWPALMDKTLKEIEQCCRQMLLTSIEKTLAARSETKLCYEMKRVTDGLFNRLLKQQKEILHNIVTCETHKPITFAVDRSRTLTTSTLQELKEQRQEIRMNEYFDKQDSRQRKTTQPEDRKRKINEAKNHLGSDPYVREVSVMARPFAFYDIASERLLDHMAIHLEHGLIHQLQSGLKGMLLQELQATNVAHCALLLADDPDKERMRRKLLDEKLKLEQALERLRGLY